MSAVRKQFAIIVCQTSRLDAKMSIQLKEHVMCKSLQQKNERDKLQHLSRELSTT